MKYLRLFARIRKEWVIVLLLLLAVVLTGLVALQPLLRPSATLRLGDGLYATQIVQTEAQRERGLSGTTSLAPDQAMLFVFDRSDTWGIWMKDMQYPIDVVWLNEQKQVVYSVSNMQPNSYPQVFHPKQPARYVVELPAGAIVSKAIHTGAVAQFSLPGSTE